MTTFELRPRTSRARLPEANQIVWMEPTVAPVLLRSEIDPWLRQFGTVPDATIDLVRLAIGAFCADQRVGRTKTLTRTIDLRVHLADPDRFSDDILDRVAELLSSLSADAWIVGVLEEETARRPRAGVRVEAGRPVDRIALLSGGLDSFSGAVHTSGESGIRTASTGRFESD